MILYLPAKRLKTIFTQASDKEIAKYEKQLENVKILDLALIITPSKNQAWIHQYGLSAYHTVMNALATRVAIFHFTCNTEIYIVRRNNNFFIPPTLRAHQ